MTVLSIQRTVSGALASATEARLTVTNSAGSAVVNNVLVEPESTGIYVYETAYLTPGLYTATWTFTTTGQPTATVSRVFEADGVVSLVQGVTLADIERRLARYVGPYYRHKASSTGTTVSQVYIPRLKTRHENAGPEDMYILRRGMLWDGSLIANFNEDDRVRMVYQYASTTGIITPDQDWAVAPSNNEAIEFHYLDPEQELRPMAQDGLARCFFWDTAITELLTTYAQVNLTSMFPWITSPTQIADVSFQTLTSRIAPSNMRWWKPYGQGGAVYMNTDWFGAGQLALTVLRPHSSYVNGEVSRSGPNSDSDILNVDLEYASVSGAVQAWVQLTDRLTSVAAQGNRLTSEMISQRFTNLSVSIAKQAPERVSHRWDSAEVLTQVGNSAEVEA